MKKLIKQVNTYNEGEFSIAELNYNEEHIKFNVELAKQAFEITNQLEQKREYIEGGKVFLIDVMKKDITLENIFEKLKEGNYDTVIGTIYSKNQIIFASTIEYNNKCKMAYNEYEKHKYDHLRGDNNVVLKN